jgi:membrane associated rhomboid family serine protease
MSDSPRTDQLLDESEETYCYGHPDTPTKLRCSRCDRPICGRCAIPASVGQHCPECVAEARRSRPKVRTALAANAPAVLVLLVTNVVVYIGQQLLGFDAVTGRFAQVPGAIVDGEWYRLVTAMFLHAPNVVLHLLFNMYVLYVYGPHVEQAFGTPRFLVLYLGSGFVASAASFAFGPCNAIGVGASGAIFGVAGALLVFTHNRRRQQFMANFQRSLLIFIGLNLVLGFAIAGIDNVAHIGGLLAGGAIGAGFDRPSERTALGPQLATAALIIGIGLALVIWRSATFSCSLFG